MNILKSLDKNPNFREAYKTLSNYALSTDDFDDDSIDVAFMDKMVFLYEEPEIKDLNFLGITKNIKDFFRAFSHCAEQVEKYDKIMLGGIFLPNISSNDVYLMLKVDKALVVDEFITRSFDAAYSKAQNFKTKGSGNNAMKRYFNLIWQYKNQMYPENIQRLRALEMTVEMDGVDPPEQKKRQPPPTGKG